MKFNPCKPSARETKSVAGRLTLPDLSKREQILLARIASANPEQGCRASNRQLTKLLKIAERQVRRDLAALRKKNLITVRIESGNERSIHLKGRSPLIRLGPRK